MSANANGLDECIDNHARERAETAYSAAVDAYGHLGELTREVAGLRADMKIGFKEIRAELRGRASKSDVQELVEEHEEITAVRMLKRELAAVREQSATVERRAWAVVKWILGIVSALVVAYVCARMGWHVG